MAENLEQELVKLEQEYAQKRAEIESREQAGEAQPEKETVREVVREQIEAAPAPQAAPPSDDVQTPPVQAAPPGDDTPSYQRPELQAHVQELINLAFEKSIKEAIDKVKAAHNPALLDAFHDALTDNLYNELVERGQIKELTSS